VNRSVGRGTRKPGKEKKMVQEIAIDDLKKRIDDDESFILVNAADNVSVCSMDAIKGTYCIPRKQLLGQLAALFSKSVHFVIYCVTPKCASDAAKELDEHGYTHVEYVNGTLLEWKDKGYPTESLWPAYDWHD
jgi:rhodanese-related sulfurtransferase